MGGGHLLRIWKRPVAPGQTTILGLYRAGDEAEPYGLLRAPPLFGWMQITVIALEPHPDNPAAVRADPLPRPRLTLVYRLEATLGHPLDVGDIAQDHGRIVPLTGGTFSGPALNATLLPGASADWQIVLPEGTALGDIRSALQTDHGDLLYVQSRSVRHGSADVLARLARGEDVDPGEYTFRASTQIETAAPDLDRLSQGVFVSVGGRQAAGVAYDTYLVG